MNMKAGDVNGWTGRTVKVPSPKSGCLVSYLVSEKSIAELNCFDRHHGAWFSGDLVIGDGTLYFATVIDPAFLLLPILDHAEASIGEVFQAWQQLVETTWACTDKHVSDLLKDALPCLCACRDVGEERFYRLDTQRVMAWLKCKIQKTVAGLRSLGETYTTMNETDLDAYAVGMLCEYLSPKWQCKLRTAYGNVEPAVEQGVMPLMDVTYKSTPSSGNRPAKTQKVQLDAKAIARMKAREAAAEKKAQQIKRQSAGMKKMSSFFSKTKSSQNSENTTG